MNLYLDTSTPEAILVLEDTQTGATFEYRELLGREMAENSSASSAISSPSTRKPGPTSSNSRFSRVPARSPACASAPPSSTLSLTNSVSPFMTITA